jgi:hypothetical protein
VTAEVITAVEAELDQWCPGHWRRLTVEEMLSDPLPLFRNGWRIELAERAVRPPGVGHFQLVIDAVFPYSQPRVLAPDLGSNYCWPHVEPKGLLCLQPTSIVAPAGDRVRAHLDDALELLNWSDDKCVAEFEREFASYWAYQAITPGQNLRLVCLVPPGGKSRVLAFHLDVKVGQVVVADTKAEVKDWLRNFGTPTRDYNILPSFLLRLPRPWPPSHFPQTVGDIIHGIPEDALRAILLPDRKSLFIFEVETSTGTVFAAALAIGAKNSKIKNGFRSWARVPLDRIKHAMAQQRVERVVASRVDPSWIHGRDHSPEQAALRARRVAIVGCGALGCEIAELLAKAGVGELTLIDGDNFLSANAGRHLLGLNYLGWNKAKGVATELQRRLPHLKIGAIHPKNFERLSAPELGKLVAVDMIVTAGIDIEGEAAVNAWRQTLDRPPAYLSTWVEAYAIVGHAVLLYGKDDLMSAFEANLPSFRLTDWPYGAGEVIVEAGCSNVFQPHGAVDLQPTIALATMLVLDALLGRVPASCRRVWFGDRNAVTARGGVVRDGFTEINAMRQIPW